jgi:uncharacterized damage-inducible protein DinB
MPHLLDTLRTHLDYSTWASTKLIRAAETLTPDELIRDFATADRTVLGTLVHIFAADRIWLRRVRGQPHIPFLDPARELRLETLQTEWPQILTGWTDVAANWTEDSLNRLVEYRQFSGGEFATPIWQIVLHLVNHATHHRGQAAGFLRAMGHQPPKLDLIFYYRELATAGSAHA